MSAYPCSRCDSPIDWGKTCLKCHDHLEIVSLLEKIAKNEQPKLEGTFDSNAKILSRKVSAVDIAHIIQVEIRIMQAKFNRPLVLSEWSDVFPVACEIMNLLVSKGVK